MFHWEFFEGLDILLQATIPTEVKMFRDLTDDEAREDGFFDAKDTFEGMKLYYSDLTPDSKLGIIRYQIPKINGV